MAMMPGALRAALASANVPNAEADAAAVEVAQFDQRPNAIDIKLGVLTALNGIMLTLTLLVIGSQFALWARLGEISAQLAALAGRH